MPDNSRPQNINIVMPKKSRWQSTKDNASKFRHDSAYRTSILKIVSTIGIWIIVIIVAAWIFQTIVVQLIINNGGAPVIKGICQFGESSSSIPIIGSMVIWPATNLVVQCYMHPEFNLKSSSQYQASQTATNPAQAANGVMQALGLSQYSFQTSSGQSLDTQQQISSMRAQMSAVWESQYAGGQQSGLSQQIDFKINQMQLIPSTINGWVPSNISGLVDINNLGNQKISVTSWINCTSPRSPNICGNAGFTYSCTPSSGIPSNLATNCAYNDVKYGTQPGACIYYNDLLPSAVSRKTCNTITVGSYTPWCDVILSYGNAQPGIYTAFLSATGVTEFIDRARVDIPIIQKSYANTLLINQKLTFSDPTTVNIQNPVSTGIGIAQIPLIVDSSQPLESSATISYSVQTSSSTSTTSSNPGTVKDVRFYVVKMTPQIVQEMDPGNSNWVCGGKSLFTGGYSVKLGSVTGFSTSDFDSLKAGTYSDPLVQKLWTEYMHSSDLNFCVVNSKSAENNVLDFKYKINPMAPGQNRDFGVIGVDMVYDFEKTLGPASINIDCSSSTYNTTFNGCDLTTPIQGSCYNTTDFSQSKTCPSSLVVQSSNGNCYEVNNLVPWTLGSQVACNPNQGCNQASNVQQTCPTQAGINCLLAGGTVSQCCP